MSVNCKRNYGIDLLRLVLMYMVCMLHTLGRGGVLNLYQPGITGYKFFWILEILSFGAVDGFALLSGYVDTGKPRKFEKLVEMWFQVFFYSFVVTALLTVTGLNPFLTFGDLITCAFPVIYINTGTLLRFSHYILQCQF